jgi:hypothetical protein
MPHISAEQVLLDVGRQCRRTAQEMEPIIKKVVNDNWYDTADDLMEATSNGTVSTILQELGLPQRFYLKLLEKLRDLGLQVVVYEDVNAAESAEAKPEAEAEAEAEDQPEAEANAEAEAEGKAKHPVSEADAEVIANAEAAGAVEAEGRATLTKRRHEDEQRISTKSRRVGSASRLSPANIREGAEKAAAARSAEDLKKQDHIKRWSSKVFVGGIPWKDYISKDHIKAVFERNVGAVQNVNLQWGTQHGYCFLTFTNPEAAKKCLAMRIELEGVRVEVRQNTPKLSVGTLAPTITEEALREHFDNFGQLDMQIKGRSASISFSSIEVTAAVLALGSQTINGTVVEIKDLDEEISDVKGGKGCKGDHCGEEKGATAMGYGNRSLGLCRYWSKGWCAKGYSCGFWHEPYGPW